MWRDCLINYGILFEKVVTLNTTKRIEKINDLEIKQTKSLQISKSCDNSITVWYN